MVGFLFYDLRRGFAFSRVLCLRTPPYDNLREGLDARALLPHRSDRFPRVAGRLRVEVANDRAGLVLLEPRPELDQSTNITQVSRQPSVRTGSKK